MHIEIKIKKRTDMIIGISKVLNISYSAPLAFKSDYKSVITTYYA